MIDKTLSVICQLIRLLLVTFITSNAWVSSALASDHERTVIVDTSRQDNGHGQHGPQDTVQLSTQQIREAFADVRDDAKVQDTAGTVAVNYWYANGAFTNQWSNSSGSGEVTGQWRAENNQRCILFESGLPTRIGEEVCAPVYRRGASYLSLNPDGSIHGIHTLSPIGSR